jgi:DNA-binding PadR family transcriptional regulator
VSLKHALLGLLSYEPMTGYELKQFFDSSIEHFWNAELSQIYPTLKSLEDADYVVKHLRVQETRPNRKVYEITEAGREEFLRWMRTPAPPVDLRDAFLIKVFLGTEIPVEDMLVLMRRQMEEHQKAMAFDEAILRPRIAHAVQHEKFTTKHGLFWTLTLEMSLAYRRAYVEWCERSMRLLEESLLDEGRGSPPEGRPDRGAQTA